MGGTLKGGEEVVVVRGIREGDPEVAVGGSP